MSFEFLAHARDSRPGDRAFASVLDYVRHNAARQPDALAVTGTEPIGYRDLGRRVGGIAHVLAARGIGPGAVVAVALEKSPDLIATVLSIFRLGAVYLPIDPQLPAARINYMVSDAGAVAIVTSRSISHQLPDVSRGMHVIPDKTDTIATDLGAADHIVSATDPAYLIYTSGSTGLPKGVLVGHGGLVAILADLAELLNFTTSDRFLLTATISFDISIAEMLLPLFVGGAVAIGPREGAVDATAMMRAATVGGATFVQATPTLWRHLLQQGWQGKHDLTAVAAGEPLPRGLADDILARTGRLWNLYGPTETTIYCTGTPVHVDGTPITIGYPIPSADAQILDDAGQPVPVGAWGELWIGGPIVAIGYHNRLDLTEQRFRPYSPGKTRGYFTGDIARRRADGAIELQGRSDNQVKIRGVRMELGEIEAVLQVQEGIQHAAVAVQQAPSGEKQLVAFLVAKPGAAPLSIDAVRTAMLRQLPAAMIPARIRFLPAFPITASGKLDRRALSETEIPEEVLDLAPADWPVAASLTSICKIWADVMDRPDVMPVSNFFALGGDSLQGMRILARLNDTFGQDLTLRNLLDNPTPSGLAALLGGRTGNADKRRPVSWETTNGDGETYPLSFAQKRFWFLAKLQRKDTVIEVSAFLKGQICVEALIESLGQTIQRHAALRTVFGERNGVPFARLTPSTAIALRVLDFTHIEPSIRAEKQKAALDAFRSPPFRLDKGPMIRASLMQLGDDEAQLVLLIHHIAADAWSIGPLLRDLFAYYADVDAALPPVTSYEAFARAQREYLTTSRQQDLIAYWTAQLADFSGVLDIPSDYPRPAEPSEIAGRVNVRLTRDQADGLRRLAAGEESTVYCVLLSGFFALLHRHSGATDIVVGTPMAERKDALWDNTVGPFLNTVPIRVQNLDRMTFRAAIRQLRETVLKAHEHQSLPVEQIIEAVNPPRDASRTPLFQAYFNMLMPHRLDLPAEVTIRLENMVEETARYDLSLYAVDHGDAIDLHLIFPTLLFHPSTAALFLADFVQLLRDGAAGPDRRSIDLAVADRPRGPTPANSAELLWKRDEDVSIGTVLRRVATLHPRQPAIVWDEGEITYSDLDRQTDALAAAILARYPEERGPIALLLGHGAPAIIGLLAVLKAGRPYVPLDPSYPEAHLVMMVEDVGATLVLGDPKVVALSALQAAIADRPVMYLSDVVPGHTLLPAVSADAPAYVLYTSGTTGRPKGIIQSHRNILQHIHAYASGLGLSCRDKLSLIPSYGFDAAIMDIFGALLCGSTLYPFDLRCRGFIDLHDFLTRHRINILHCTPTVFRHLLTGDPSGKTFPDVTYIVLGGEAATVRDWRLTQQFFPAKPILINGLGPTESTLALQNYLSADTPPEGELLSVGYPVAGVDVRLLIDGEDNQIFGEIGIVSDAVALGYWQRADLTASAFGIDPCSGRRMYRTGDYGRRLPDGKILFLGRRDHQVKIRGHRVELNSVEALLADTAGVESAAVLLHQENDETLVIAYLVLALGATAESVRQCLAERLPSYMVPTHLLPVEHLPMTPTGKIDRLALTQRPLPKFESVAIASPDPSLDEMAMIWRDVLGAGDFDGTTDFFAVGGHSLLLLRLQGLIHTKLKASVSLRSLFQSPTLAGMAENLRAARVV